MNLSIKDLVTFTEMKSLTLFLVHCSVFTDELERVFTHGNIWKHENALNQKKEKTRVIFFLQQSC